MVSSWKDISSFALDSPDCHPGSIMGTYVEDGAVSWKAIKANSRCATPRRVFKRNSSYIGTKPQGDSRAASIGRVSKANKGFTLKRKEAHRRVACSRVVEERYTAPQERAEARAASTGVVEKVYCAIVVGNGRGASSGALGKIR